MIFKENFEDDGILSLFLKDIPKSYIPKRLQQQRGMKKSKLDKIKLQLVSRMPVTRRKFWEELPTSENVTDLLGSGQTDFE